jgi:AraC-like DNA-binding protein
MMIESVTGYLLETVRGLDPVGPARGNAIALAQILLVFAPHALPKTAPAQGKRTTNPAFRKRRFSMRICSTSALPAHERFPFWADVVASTFVKLDCEAPQRDHFFGSVRHCTIGHSEIVDVASDAQSATRSRQGIALDSSDSLIVNLQILGDCLIETPQLATVIGVGQAAIVETAEKYRLMFPQRFRQIVLKLPRSIVGTQPLQSHGTLLRPSAARLLVQMSCWALHEADAIGEGEGQAFQKSIAEILRCGLPTEEFSEELDTPAKVRYQRAIDLIDIHLAKSTLTSARLARELGVSVRSLARLFKSRGSTVEEVIWQRRLDAARHDLLDCRLAQRKITEIAFARGFSDLSHFSRRFAEAYGQSPRKFRSGDQRTLAERQDA